MSREILLHGVLRRCILMGCLWIMCMHLHDEEESLEGMRGGTKGAPLRCRCLKHCMYVKKRSKGLGALIFHQRGAGCFPARLILTGWLHLLGLRELGNVLPHYWRTSVLRAGRVLMPTPGGALTLADCGSLACRVAHPLRHPHRNNRNRRQWYRWRRSKGVLRASCRIQGIGLPHLLVCCLGRLREAV